jgi:outer membrane protein assembly factor BamD (BamD/ComL family)
MYEKAVQRFESILETEPENKKAQEYLNLAKQKLEEKIKKEKEAEKMKEVERIYTESVKQFNKNNYAEAISGFKKIISLVGDYKDVKKIVICCRTTVQCPNC